MVHAQGEEVVPGIKVEISIFQIIPRTEQEQFLSEESNFLRSHPSTLEQSRYKLREKSAVFFCLLEKLGMMRGGLPSTKITFIIPFMMTRC